MKILIHSVEFPPGPGGMGMQAYQLARHLTGLGNEVVAAVPQNFASASEVSAFNQGQPFKVISLQFRGPALFEGLYRILRILREGLSRRPSVIIGTGRQALWVAVLVGKLLRIPVAAIGIGTEFLVPNRAERALTRWGFASANLVIYISRFTAELAERQGFKARRSEVIPLGADDSLYRPGLPVEEMRRRLGLAGKQVILTVGQVSERKAQDVVIRALPQVLQTCPNAVYLVAGLPTLQEKLEKLAEELGVREQVIFYGKAAPADLPLLYNLADLFVLVSRQTHGGDVEGYGIVAVEAALCKVPAVVSENSGLVEAVAPGETALVVPADDPPATAQAIVRLLSDSALRQQMGEAAYQRAITSLTWEQRVREYQAALQSLLPGRARSGGAR